MLTSATKRIAPLVGALVVITLQVFLVQTASAEGGTSTDLDAGGAHACAITPAERLKCWGDNTVGQLGLGDNLEDQYKPVVVPGLDHVKRVSIGSSTTCAVVGSAGKLRCWGYNAFGQIGDGTTDDRHIPVTVIASGVKQVDVGRYHTCATLQNGNAKCWGTNTYGELGDGTTDLRLEPQQVDRLSNAAHISAGANYTCATTTGGKAKCWGTNKFGTLGDGTLVNRPRPTQVSGLTQNVRVVKTGYLTTCAIVGDGRLKCWGSDTYGEMGLGSTGGLYPQPTNVPGMDKNVKSVDPDYYFVCAQQNDKAKCWGYNVYGQLGTGDVDNRDEATTVQGLGKNVVDVTAADYHACALLKSGSAKCWGYNGNGEVGNDTAGTTNWTTPQAVLL